MISFSIRFSSSQSAKNFIFRTSLFRIFLAHHLLPLQSGELSFGILSDRYGRKNVLQWTILTYSLGTFLCGLATNFGFLIFFRVITGLGVGGEWATGQTYIGETFPPRLRGRFGAFMQTGAPIGIALASVVGGFISPIIGWRACFFISVLPALIVVFIRKKLPESDMWLERKRLISENVLSTESLHVEESNKFLMLFSRAYRTIFILSLILAIFDMSAYWFTYTWLPGYLYQERHFSMTKSAEWILVTQAGGFIGYFTFGFVADKLGRRPAYSIYSVIMAVGLVMITLMWNAIASTPALILAFMFLVGFGTGMFGGYVALFRTVSDYYPEHGDGDCV